jgi:acetyltransferase-like isoleucine patch superfamily enzyme
MQALDSPSLPHSGAQQGRIPAEDPLSWIPRAVTKLHSLWLSATYGFAGFGAHVSIHYSCEIRRCHALKIRIEDYVMVHSGVWLSVPLISSDPDPNIVIGRGCNLGRGSAISARNQIRLEENVLLGPSVFITDHNHKYSDPELPIMQQGMTEGGRVIIERNCWLGYGCVILAKRGTVVIGRNSVIGAHAVVTESCPPHSVLAGNPARVVKTFDAQSRLWKAV